MAKKVPNDAGTAYREGRVAYPSTEFYSWYRPVSPQLRFRSQTAPTRLTTPATRLPNICTYFGGALKPPANATDPPCYSNRLLDYRSHLSIVKKALQPSPPINDVFEGDLNSCMF